MIYLWQSSRGYRPMGDADRAELVDIFDALLDVGHTVEESCNFMLAYAAGEVS